MRFTCLETISRGSFSVVYLGTDQQRACPVAIKTIDKKRHEAMLRYFYQELAIIQELEHPNIVKLLNHYENDLHLNLVFEYCGGGSLANYLPENQPLPELLTRRIMTGVKNGLCYLNQRKIIHRDLKPENILLLSKPSAPAFSPSSTLLFLPPLSDIKIIDFGFAKRNKEQELNQTICGTPYYMAPEIVKYSDYNDKVDLWSFGVILYRLLSGQMPYLARNQHELLQQIEYTEPDYSSIPVQSQSLIKQLLVCDPHERMTWLDFSRHPWFETKSQPINIPRINLEDYDHQYLERCHSPTNITFNVDDCPYVIFEDV